MMRRRCEWAEGGSSLDRQYHDEEWGVPVHDDRVLFEFLILEGAQAGLSWSTVLKKRAHYYEVFDGFEVRKVADYGEQKIRQLLADPGIIRNRLKVRSAVQNANAFLKVQSEFGSFDSFLWRALGGAPKINYWQTQNEVPATTEESDALAKDLKQRGFNFVGSTICYAYMQAVGLVIDHTVDCYRFNDLS
jgi:DNA-3-methyladenine glycosylase I